MSVRGGSTVAAAVSGGGTPLGSSSGAGCAAAGFGGSFRTQGFGGDAVAEAERPEMVGGDFSEEISISLLVILGIVVLLGGWAVSSYGSLVRPARSAGVGSG